MRKYSILSLSVSELSTYALVVNERFSYIKTYVIDLQQKQKSNS